MLLIQKLIAQRNNSARQPFSNDRKFRRLNYWAVLFIQAICLNTLFISNVFAVFSWDDTFKPYVGVDLLYDSNLLRLSDSFDLQSVGKSSKADFVTTLNTGIAMDWTLGQQQFIAQIDLNYDWYQNFDQLDYFGWDIQAQWNWKIASDWTGTFGYSNTRAMGGYEQINSVIALAQNVYTFARYDANISYLFHPRGRASIGFFRTENKYLENKYIGKLREISNLTENNVELNLDYLSPDNSSIGVRVLATDGQYPKRPSDRSNLLKWDTGFLRMDYALTYTWNWSQKTKVYGRFGYTQQQGYHYETDNHFGFLTGQINADWAPTEQTFISFMIWREIRKVDDLQAGFTLSQGAQIGPTWDITAKIKMSASFSYEHQEYLDKGFTSTQRQKDQIWRFVYNLIYNPLENITLDLMLGYEEKGSNFEFAPYESFSTGLNMQVAF